MKAIKYNKTFFDIMVKLAAYEYEVKSLDIVKKAKKSELSRDEYWDWCGKQNDPAYPISSGECKAYRLWYWNERDELNFDDFVCEHEAHDFIDTLRKAGVKTFTVTNTGTSLMENIHWFEAEGCTLLGTCRVESIDPWECKHGHASKMGLRFSL